QAAPALREAAVGADQHAETADAALVDREAQVAVEEVALLQRVGLLAHRLLRAGNVYLAVHAEQRAVGVEDRRAVEAAVAGALGEGQDERHAGVARGGADGRDRRGVEAVLEVALPVGVVHARREVGREGQLGKGDELDALDAGLVDHPDEPRRVLGGDLRGGSELGGGDADLARHGDSSHEPAATGGTDPAALAATGYRWQATAWSGVCGVRAGATSAQTGMTWGQRVRKRQPDGGSSGLGRSPASGGGRRPRGRSTSGTAASRARV